jgi:hypothetical protein
MKRYTAFDLRRHLQADSILIDCNKWHLAIASHRKTTPGYARKYSHRSNRRIGVAVRTLDWRSGRTGIDSGSFPAKDRPNLSSLWHRQIGISFGWG